MDPLQTTRRSERQPTPSVRLTDQVHSVHPPPQNSRHDVTSRQVGVETSRLTERPNAILSMTLRFPRFDGTGTGAFNGYSLSEVSVDDTVRIEGPDGWEWLGKVLGFEYSNSVVTVEVQYFERAEELSARMGGTALTDMLRKDPGFNSNEVYVTKCVAMVEATALLGKATVYHRREYEHAHGPTGSATPPNYTYFYQRMVKLKEDQETPVSFKNLPFPKEVAGLTCAEATETITMVFRIEVQKYFHHPTREPVRGVRHTKQQDGTRVKGPGLPKAVALQVRSKYFVIYDSSQQLLVKRAPLTVRLIDRLQLSDADLFVFVS